MKIELKLHEDKPLFLLESQDIYQYIREDSEYNMRLAAYIDKWCEYLNHLVLRNQEMAFGDTLAAGLSGWIAGYNYAKSIECIEGPDKVVIRHGRHTITLNRPRIGKDT